MINQQTQKRAGARGVLLCAALVAGLGGLYACTNLTESPFSTITPESFYRNEEEVRSGVLALYSQLNTAVLGGYNYHNTITSDEQVIPVRGQDWFNNGRELEAQRHVWQANSPAGLGAIAGAWNEAFTGISRANLLLAAIEPLPIANKPRTVAEIRLLRAYFYYQLLDLFGGVPIATDPAIEARPRATRAETFKFVEQELLAARTDLPVSWPRSEYGRVTRGAADAILASLYLNAEVFTGTVSVSGLQKGTARWQEAATAADRVISGPYSLSPDWAANFRADNDRSPEQVFVIARKAETGAGLDMTTAGLHYNQVSPAPNNGRAVEPTTFRKFDPADKRMDSFLVGRQRSLVTGDLINDRTGAPLVYTVDIQDITQATEGEGVRLYKWPLDPNRSVRNNGNDFAIYRLAEMYLIKAEALNELGQTGAAVQLLNVLRDRVFEPKKPLSSGLSQSQVREAVLNERLFELFAEGKRRTDLIRQGKWSDPWFAKERSAGYRILMPIPQPQMDVNPLLEQNPGY